MTALVLSLNPAVDLEWRVERVLWEEKNLIQSERRWAGGKGVNVARWLRHLGGQPRLLLPLGGSTGVELRRHLRAERLLATVILVGTANRTDIIVTTNNGQQLRFNPAGPVLSRQEWSLVFQQVEKALPAIRLLILSGSLPRSAPATVYAQLIRRAHHLQVPVLLDCDGKALEQAVAAQPFFTKPNEHELVQWSGRSLTNDLDIRRAARALSAQTHGWVLVSRGERTAYLINTRQRAMFSAVPPRVEKANSVGAGDAVLAAAARQIEQGLPPDQWLRSGLAAGSAATQCQAGELPALTMIERLERHIIVRPLPWA